MVRQQTVCNLRDGQAIKVFKEKPRVERQGWDGGGGSPLRFTQDGDMLFLREDKPLLGMSTGM